MGAGGQPSYVLIATARGRSPRAVAISTEGIPRMPPKAWVNQFVARATLINTLHTMSVYITLSGATVSVYIQEIHVYCAA